MGRWCGPRGPGADSFRYPVPRRSPDPQLRSAAACRTASDRSGRGVATRAVTSRISDTRVRCATALWAGRRARIMRAGPVGGSGRPWSEGELPEMAVGIALILISAFLIFFIVRTVQANMPSG